MAGQKQLLTIFVVVGWLGWLLAVVAECTKYWLSGIGRDIHGRVYDAHYGLFWCNSLWCASWLEAAQAMTIIGIILGGIGLILVAYVILMDQVKALIPLAGGAATLGGGMFEILGIIIFGAETESDQLDWSFALATVGGILMAAAGALVLIMGRRSPS